MPTHPPVHVEIDLNRGSEPMSGRIRSEDGEVLEFTGVLELIGLIDAQMEEACEQERRSGSPLI